MAVHAVEAVRVAIPCPSVETPPTYHSSLANLRARIRVDIGSVCLPQSLLQLLLQFAKCKPC